MIRHLALAFLVVSVAPSFADTAPATLTSTVNQSVAAPKDHDDIQITYTGNYHGQPLNRLDSGRTVDRNGDFSVKNRPVNVDSELDANYMITNSFGLGPVLPFLAIPTYGQGLVLGEMGFRALDKKTVDYKGLVVSTNLIAQLPTSDYSKQLKMDFALKTTPAIRYSIPASRFTVGAFTEAKQYFGVAADKTFKLWALPYVAYRFAESLSAQLAYEYETHHNVGELYGNLTKYQSDVQPGLIWNVTPHVLVNPYVAFYTTRRATFDTAAVGTFVSATVF